MSKIAKRRAASLKAWRTRRKMKQARLNDPLKPLRDKLLAPWEVPNIPHEPYEPHSSWPAYIRRALPLPEFGT